MQPQPGRRWKHEATAVSYLEHTLEGHPELLGLGRGDDPCLPPSHRRWCHSAAAPPPPPPALSGVSMGFGERASAFEQCRHVLRLPPAHHVLGRRDRRVVDLHLRSHQRGLFVRPPRHPALLLRRHWLHSRRPLAHLRLGAAEAPPACLVAASSDAATGMPACRPPHIS